MASKLRRAPLFGIDSGFSIVSPCKSKGVFQMECEVTSSPASSYGTNSTASSRTTTNGGSPTGGHGTTTSSSTRNNSTGSTKSQLHVDFMDSGEVKEKREKYLTAKYGSHQMSLIRKRLSVEMWLYDELQKLYEGQDGSTSNHDVEIDLDEVLDMDGDGERRKFLLSLLTGAKKSQDVVNKFIDDVLEKAKTL